MGFTRTKEATNPNTHLLMGFTYRLSIGAEKLPEMPLELSRYNVFTQLLLYVY